MAYQFQHFYEDHMNLNMCLFHEYFADPGPLTMAQFTIKHYQTHFEL